MPRRVFATPVRPVTPGVIAASTRAGGAARARRRAPNVQAAAQPWRGTPVPPANREA
ncbi:MAG TPA: hypothetical protein VGX50_11595 [Longimicrobium sp.]|nr:hypothetical protein [Longimicrobium sp.]